MLITAAHPTHPTYPTRSFAKVAPDLDAAAAAAAAPARRATASVARPEAALLAMADTSRATAVRFAQVQTVAAHASPTPAEVGRPAPAEPSFRPVPAWAVAATTGTRLDWLA